MAKHSFQYTARKADGTTIENTATAKDRKDLAQKLASQGLTLEHATQAQHIASVNGVDRFLLRFSRVKLIEKVFFMQHLEVMLRTGFSIGRALQTLALQTTNKKFQVIIDEIRKQVEGGVAFSKALRGYPKEFPELMVNMVEAGEVSGKLDQTLKQITVQMRKEHEIRAKVRGAMIYPIIVVIAMVGIGIAMMVFVIPQITSIYEESNAKLPLPTQVLITMSHFVVKNGVLVGIGSIVFVVGFGRLLRTRRGRHAYHHTLLVLPIVGSIIRKVNLARFARTLSGLLQTDIPIVKAFTVIASTLGNVIYRDFVAGAVDKLKAGQQINVILEEEPKLFPPVVTNMIAIGEESGTLDETSSEVASFYEQEVDQTMANLSQILEPILMLLLGVGVGGMAVAILLPMYSLVNTI